MRTLASILLTTVLLALAGRPAHAQLVFGTNNLDLGRVIRGVNLFIPFLGGNSAEFWVLGTKGKKVRLTVTGGNLTLNGSSLRLVVGNADCAYSLDGGVTWTTFSTGTLIQDAIIPNSGLGLIVVRVGGTVQPTVGQTRGTYNGTVTLTAVYK
jgi:hypothetical protein